MIEWPSADTKGASERAGSEQLLAAVDDFCRRPLAELSPSELFDRLKALRFAADRIELAFSECAARFAETDEYQRRGSFSAIGCIRHECHMSANAAAERVTVGEKMAKLPESVRAVQSGEIGYAHLALLARTADALSSAKADAQFDETRLLEHAKESSVSRFYFLCQSARHAADPQGFTADERSAYERRWLKLTPGEDGRFFIRGTLDGLGGATVKAALDPLARRCGSEDERSREQRLAGALVELAHHGLDHGASPQRAGQRTHIQVTATLETLTRHTGVPAGEVEPSVPISSKAVERLACDSTITRVLLRSDSAVLDVGRSQRVVPPATRRALEARDRGCRWPGCERSASWTAAHHLVHWSRGGRTDLDNLVLICGRHHWMVHEGGWRLARGENGQLMPIRPVGEYARRPAPELGERIVDQLGRTPVRELARPPGGREVA